MRYLLKSEKDNSKKQNWKENLFHTSLHLLDQTTTQSSVFWTFKTRYAPCIGNPGKLTPLVASVGQTSVIDQLTTSTNLASNKSTTTTREWVGGRSNIK